MFHMGICYLEEHRVICLLDRLRLVYIHPSILLEVLTEKGGPLLSQECICVFSILPHFVVVCMDMNFGEEFLWIGKT